MGVGDVDDSFQCPCCIECNECKDFQKVAEINDAGLVIFRHLINHDDVEKQTEVLQSVVSPADDVFIFQNTRNVDMPAANFVPTLETFKISCLRCRKMYERAKKLLKRVPIISERHVVGVCDHCYQKQFPKTCNECDQIVNKFNAARYGERNAEDALKTWLSKMKHVLRNVIGDDGKSVQGTSRAKSDLYIDKTSQLESRALKEHKSENKKYPILIPDMRRSDTNIPGSLLYNPKHDDRGGIKSRLQAIDKSDGFLQSIRSQQDYRPDQRHIKEALKADKSKPSGFGASKQRSVFERPSEILRQMRDSSTRASLLNKTQPGKDGNIREPISKIGKSAGFLDSTRAQEMRLADRVPTGEAIGIGQAAHGQFKAHDPRSMFDRPDRTKHFDQMHGSKVLTPVYNKAKYEKGKNIEKSTHELGKSVDFKDSLSPRKRHHPGRKYTSESVEAIKPKRSAFEDGTVRPLLDEDSSVRPLFDKVSDRTLTLKRQEGVAKEKSETSVIQDKQGLRIVDQQTIKSIRKKTVPISTRPRKHVSKETLVSTISKAAQNTLGKELSYFFPMSEDTSKEPQNLKGTATSAVLIQDTHKKIEEERLRKDAQKKAENEKKKQLAEEKAKLIAEKQRLAEEKKKIAEDNENKRIAEENEKKKRADEKKRIGSNEKMEQAEEKDSKKPTKEDDKSDNLLKAKNNHDARDISNTEKGKEIIRHTAKGETSTTLKNKIKSDMGQGDLEKNKETKLRRGDKADDNKGKKENEKSAQEKLKEEKEYKQEAKDRLTKEKQEQLRMDKIDKRKEKELKETEKYKAKEENELKSIEKNKLQTEDKKGSDSTKYVEETEVKPKHKSQKELIEKVRKRGSEEKDRKGGVEEKDRKRGVEEKVRKQDFEGRDRKGGVKEKGGIGEVEHKDRKGGVGEKDGKERVQDKDLNLKGKRMSDIKPTNEDDSQVKHKNNEKNNNKGFELKDHRENGPKLQGKDDNKRQKLEQPTDETNFQEKDNIHSKKNGKNEKQKEEKSKDVKSTQKDNLVGQTTEKNIDTKEQSEKAKDKALEHKKLTDRGEAQESDGIWQKLRDAENKKTKVLTDNRNKDDAKFKDFTGNAKKGQTGDASETPKTGKKSEEVKMKEENATKHPKNATDDLILQLVKLKQQDPAQYREEAGKIDPLVIAEHHKHCQDAFLESPCIICLDSDLELDIESIQLEKMKRKLSDIIVGEKIFKFIPPAWLKYEEQRLMASLLQPVLSVSFNSESMSNPLKEIVQTAPKEAPPGELVHTTLKSKPPPDPELTKGIMRYALSDRTFIDKGWTMLPTEKVVRKMNVYRMRPAQPQFDWFEHNKKKRLMLYESGERLAEFDDNGRGRWYYKNGHLALDYYDAEEINAHQRFVVYSSGEPDERGRLRPITILATFDYLGNGVVFDHTGKIRLKYNQTEGVVLDRDIGPVSHWKWHTLNDPPVLQQVMIDTQMAHKDPQILKLGAHSDNKTRPDNDEMLAIEFDNFIKEKSRKLTQSFKPFQIKMKALKINEHFSLKVLDQATVYLIYRDGATNLKINIGMILDHKEIVDTDTAEVGEVSNSLERFPARTGSLAGLQRSVEYAQRFERARTERERRLRPAEPMASADRLTAAAARPLRPPLRTVPADTGCYCNVRKPSSCTLYYNTRLT